MAIIIEIQGIGFPNQGAELMLIVVAERLREAFGGQVIPVCRPNHKSRDSAIMMSRHGIVPLLEVSRRNIQLGACLNFTPTKFTRAFNLYRRKDVDFVLDASGLHFSDDWGLRVMRLGVKRIQAQTRKGKPFLFLPQAFGPFEDETGRRIVTPLFQKAKAVFCRDPTSLNHVRSLHAGDNLYLCPDITIAHHPANPDLSGVFANKIVFIPNQRMLDRTYAGTGKLYLSYFGDLMRGVAGAGEEVVIMNHEGERDLHLCQLFQKELGLEVVYGWPDAEANKTALGGAKAVVSSRFHGLVSALSQGVPAFCTSWNHKYRELAESFSFPNACLTMDLNKDLKSILGVIQDPGKHEGTRQGLLEKAGAQAKTVNDMWEKVFAILMDTHPSLRRSDKPAQNGSAIDE